MYLLYSKDNACSMLGLKDESYGVEILNTTGQALIRTASPSSARRVARRRRVKARPTDYCVLHEMCWSQIRGSMWTLWKRYDSTTSGQAKRR